MNLNYYDLSKSDIELLEEALENKYLMIFKSLGAIIVVFTIAFIYLHFRGRNVSFTTSLIVGTIFYIPFFCILWFGYIARIRKDLQKQKKIKFKAKVIDKVSDSVLGIEENILVLEKNETGISKVNIDNDVFVHIPLFSTVIISVALTSKTYLSCEILEE
jgi:ABC-type multidrug transport system fused ATPase/permease subunit